MSGQQKNMTEDNNLQYFAEDMNLSKTALDLSSNGQGFGLIIVDEVNGFATVGAGNLAPQIPNEQVSVMVSETNRLAYSFTQQAMPVLAFLETHYSKRSCLFRRIAKAVLVRTIWFRN